MKTVKYENRTAVGRKRPCIGQIELTYRCRYRCVHCYCRNQSKQDLGIAFWERIIDQLYDAGVLRLIFTGGDPLLYNNFLHVYDYARKKGFLITIFTAGCEFNKKILDCLENDPPLLIEITLNSLTREKYESITRARGTFGKVMKNIYEIKKRGLPLRIRCNGLRENQDEIVEIKKFAEDLLGKGHFRFDPIIFPGLDHGKEPIRHRLPPCKIVGIISRDKEMAGYVKRYFLRKDNAPKTANLYNCNPSCAECFFINPQGIMRFCYLTDKYTTDLKKETFSVGYSRILNFLAVKRRKDSKCFTCEYKSQCYNCPAKAFLETGKEQGAVEYFCMLTREMRKYVYISR